MLSRSFTEQVKFRWREFRREPLYSIGCFYAYYLDASSGFAFSEPKPEVYGSGWPADKNVSELLQKLAKF